MSPETGRKFGPYEIQDRLAGGGMGHVYRAWDARLHREVAIKLLNHEFAMPGMRERFLREARAASALNHPNICTIFDIGEQDGDPYLVMELLQGETLKDRILARTLPLDEIVTISRDTAEALGAAHSKGVVHRDIKPANIFLVDKPNGGIQAKVLDFGLAKIEGGVLGARGRSLDITTAGATVGTLAYMSPEQARGEVLDARSDLFSLGVVMYEMATRQVPFQGATSALVFVQLLNHPPEPVRDWNESIPRELEKIIFKLLAKERTARFQTARELEMALQSIGERGTGGAGWLRRAAASVPLVRAPDPVAREKRLPRSKNSSNPGLEPPRPVTPIPPTDEPERASGSDGQILRPARVPRSEGGTILARNTPAPPYRRDARPSPMPATSLPPGYLPPSMRGAQARGGAVSPVARDSEVPEPQAAAAELVLPAPGPKLPSGQSIAAPAADRVPDAAAANSAAEAMALPAANSAKPVFPWDAAEPWEDPEPHTDDPVDASSAASERKTWRRRWPLVACGLILVLGLSLGLFFFLQHPHFGPTLLNKSDVVVMTQMQNDTEDRSLGSVVSEALRIELAQSPYVTFRGGTSYWASNRLFESDSNSTQEVVAEARRSAQRLGARAYLTGWVNSSGGGYLLHVDLRDVDSSRVLGSVEERAGSLQQIPEVVDKVAYELRSATGEPRNSIDRSDVGLAREASANLAAIDIFVQAERQLAAHQPIAALADLQQAVALDPRFIQAQTQLALLYGELRAESSAAESARLGLSAADGASELTRSLAQAVFELEATGDYLKAAALLRRLVGLYPGDCDALALLARTLNLEGHLSDALQLAQQAYAKDPLNARAYTEAEFALEGLDRFDAAFQLDGQAQRLGVARATDTLTAAYLDGHQEIVNQMVASLPVRQAEYSPDWSYGLYLDNAGRMAAGTTLWATRADAAAEDEPLRSASAFLLSQGALDRALLNDCAGALAMIHRSEQTPPLPFGRQALFKSGMARALCGDTLRATQIVSELQERYPNSFEVNGFFMADIQAAIALNRKNPATAIQVLQSTHAFDPISLTPYLLGRANSDLHQPAIGIVDFQTELSHRGLAFLFGSDVYPASEMELARSFAASGDLVNSAGAYRGFLTLWRLADPAEPLLVEATTHAANP